MFVCKYPGKGRNGEREQVREGREAVGSNQMGGKKGGEE